jgi:hypothetical protein
MTGISGLAELQKTLSDAQFALEAANGELGTLTFNPQDPASIEAAIVEAERLVDERLGAYAQNAIVGPLIQQMKDAFRTAVVEKAAESRLADKESDNE